jgi:hypothetical protein
MAQVVGSVSDAVVGVAALPYIEFAFQAEGKSAFDVLDGFLERDFMRRGQEQMDVIGHDDESMEMETILCSLLLQD